MTGEILVVAGQQDSGLSSREAGTLKRPPRYPVLVVACASILVLALVVTVFADVIAPYHYAKQNLAARLQAPSLSGPYLLGTDHIGRDILSRVIYGTRMSMMVAGVGIVIASLLGTLLGFVAAHYRGWIEEGVMMAVDFQASMPFMIVALSVLAFFGNSFALFLALMGLNWWERYARLTRGLVLGATGHSYAVAVHALGATPLRIYGRHILPNIGSVLIVQLTLNFADTVLLESSLSFLGLGIQPPLTSLGAMLGEGRSYLLTAWWISVVPGVVIFFVTLSASIVGDWLRDRFDPTLR